MSILLSGDFHNNAANELSLIAKNSLIQRYSQKLYDGIRYHVILGDCGFLWPGDWCSDINNFRELSMRPFPVLCVFGNHDPALGRTDLPEADIGIGEKVLVIKEKDPFVAYLKRGGIYMIENHRFLVLGGALSIDRESRELGKSWWKQEYWSEAEKTRLFRTLKRNSDFDYVLSHTGPSRVNNMILNPSQGDRVFMFFDEVGVLNEKIDGLITCKQWFCGHWHRDGYYYEKNLNRGYQYLYRKTALMSGDKIMVK